jgi:hypothetical protein
MYALLYLMRKRFIYELEKEGQVYTVSAQLVACFLQRRLEEGFKIAVDNQGIITLVQELAFAHSDGEIDGSGSHVTMALAQYVVFPACENYFKTELWLVC